MPDQIIQSSFNSGEWSPSLYSRVDLVKYRSGAALLENFFVDYRGGASTRPGTRYVLQTKSNSTVRLIPFQAAFLTDFVLEFGDGYVRFFSNGVPVLETATTISGATNANPGVITDTAHGYLNGDWIFITGVGGMTQLNGNYYIIANKTANTYQLTDLFGVPVNTTTFGVYTSGGSAQRVYTISSPYSANEVFGIKYTQNVDQLILCHPNHPANVLTLISTTNWTLASITFGATIPAPTTPTASTTLGAGPVNYAYVVTSVDSNGQESGPSSFATLASKTDIRTTAGTNTISWSAVTNSVAYNIYRAQLSYAGAVPAGAQFGFVGTTTGVSFIDSNIAPDFSVTPPVPQNPFGGSGVQSVTVTSGGSYTSGPGVSFSGGGGSGATAFATLRSVTVSVNSSTGGYTVGSLIFLNFGIILIVTGTNPVNTTITSVAFVSQGTIISGSVPTNPVSEVSNNSPKGTGSSYNFTWSVVSVTVTSPGAGFSSPPSVVFSSGAASATATIGAAITGNPTVPGFFQQRLVLAGLTNSPQQFNMSKTGNQFNFDVSQIIQPDDAIQGTLISGKLNTIQYMIAQPQGLIVLTDQQSWLINGGSPGAPISAISINANAQSFNGANGPPPIIATNNILFVQSKNSIVRDMAFSIYTSVYSGIDISAISSHLFYGFQVVDWAWAEEPFKLVWAVRNDGRLLSLTYLKEQDFIAWTHHVTEGCFKSVATIIESTSTAGNVDAIYFVTTRQINGTQVQYIERLAERSFPAGLSSAWTVDAGINYNGPPLTSFVGAQHLAGATVTGLATDNVGKTTVITPFVMPTTGSFTLPAPASPATGYTNIVVGLPYTCSLQTLPLEVGEPTVQGKVKKINSVDIRVTDTLGLSIGSNATQLTPMKDLVIGNVSSMLTGQPSQIVTNLVDGDARTFIDPTYTVPGQYFIQQSLPLPATVLAVIPNFSVGDDGSRRG